jgi:hypothetical protein
VNRLQRAWKRCGATIQRNRRAKRHRIDYYVSAAALAIIKAQCKPRAGYDASSVINRIVESAAPFADLPKACVS